ncbi:hypothetical protein TPHA_0A02390 [Tetrapisispora phaffii CBS 4417]|uniref:RRM domain-containing protein n=1 Tax=Tetrapisispora phaffii (strain ATCC 24235 / CBS 4417 / NBRC 1672 / NRRL Y-8282 / UCD 70-5) TaxID=1071381 RepID=G8BN43_TETPH|nr:hypothetical protein TPHA_0A02390 [Tetrapisispora phaffii CBS 4417]CCE61321.1 hypothetical protein TPHA_0A02390 [Tetrapisispora phaffii CBS 4417]
MLPKDNKSVPVRTLYLSNLPSRPESKDNFIKFLLSQINPTNKYITSSELPLHTLEGINKEKLLDEEKGIVSISLSRKLSLKKQCFLTFENHAKAKEFRSQYSNFKINSQRVRIKYANKDSLLGLAMRNQSLLKKVLKSRKSKKELSRNNDLLVEKQLKRKIRRVRASLRKRGISEDEIEEISTKLRKEQNIIDSSKIQKLKTIKIQEKKNLPPKSLLL